MLTSARLTFRDCARLTFFFAVQIPLRAAALITAAPYTLTRA
jgi:hypothetical protein